MDQYLYLWHSDSAYARAIKWLLLYLNIAHEDYFLQWHELSQDPLLKVANPKRQVPALLRQSGSKEPKTLYDSWMIALHFLPKHWQSSQDARLFRLADSDLSDAMRGFYRVYRFRKQPDLKDTRILHALKDENWQAWQRCMHWCELTLNPKEPPSEVGVGAVLLHSVIASASYFDRRVLEHLPSSLKRMLGQVEHDNIFKRMASDVNGHQSVPFFIHADSA